MVIRRIACLRAMLKSVEQWEDVGPGDPDWVGGADRIGVISADERVVCGFVDPVESPELEGFYRRLDFYEGDDLVGSLVVSYDRKTYKSLAV